MVVTATGEAVIADGKVVAVNVINTGQNYQVVPHVEFRGGGGSGVNQLLILIKVV